MTQHEMGGCCGGGSCATDAGGQASSGTKTYTPRADVVDTGSAIEARLEVPGASPETVDLNLEKGVLTVRAQVRQPSEPTRWLRREYGVGTYERSFRLGEGVDGSQISAECADGVLTVRIAKAADAGPRRIAVSGGA